MARTKRKPTEAVAPPDAQLRNRRFELVDTERAGVKAHRVTAPDRIRLLLNQRKMTTDEHSACEHFKSQWQIAYGSDLQISRYDKGIAHGGNGASQQHALAAVRQLASRMGREYEWLVGVVIYDQAPRTLRRQMTCRNGQEIPRFRGAVRSMAHIWGLPMDPDTKC